MSVLADLMAKITKENQNNAILSPSENETLNDDFEKQSNLVRLTPIGFLTEVEVTATSDSVSNFLQNDSTAKNFLAEKFGKLKNIIGANILETCLKFHWNPIILFCR